MGERRSVGERGGGGGEKRGGERRQWRENRDILMEIPTY